MFVVCSVTNKCESRRILLETKQLETWLVERCDKSMMITRVGSVAKTNRETKGQEARHCDQRFQKTARDLRIENSVDGRI